MISLTDIFGDHCILVNEYGLIENSSTIFDYLYEKNYKEILSEGVFIFHIFPELINYFLINSPKFKKIFKQSSEFLEIPKIVE